MGERKVMNKYYPADFDPEKIPRRNQPKNQQIRATKFNSRKESVESARPTLGILIIGFAEMQNCCAEVTLKTDPQNSDYVVECGASRNFEPWRAEDEVVEKEKQKRDAEELGDAMKSLENRNLIRAGGIATNEYGQKAKKIEEEDDAALALYKGLKDKCIKRIRDQDIEDDKADFGRGDIKRRKTTYTVDTRAAGSRPSKDGRKLRFTVIKKSRNGSSSTDVSN
ncbi:hypothetical protein Leryth_014998 [Lithospermum erythrorhizon]|nr:hypothetical protein Leryth_014998 [Lithospermum erythrorhizon]